MNEDPLSTRPTRAEISFSALAHNFQIVRQQIAPAKILAVVKAEGYGHGLIRMAQEFARLGADYLGVSFLEEGVLLRQAGINTPILVMGGLVDEQVEHYLDFDLTMTVSSVWKAKQAFATASRHSKKARIHLKFDTGIGRVGQSWNTAEVLLKEALRLQSHLEIEGIYTHFASAESLDLSFARTQLHRFGAILDQAHKAGLTVPLIHAANSGAIIQLPGETRFDMVRPGLLLYGHAPAEHLETCLPLKPVMTLKTRVVFVKKPPAGTPIGYGSTWHSPGDCWIATLPIGYGDGYPRRAGNQASVILRGRICQVVGAVSMDQITINAGNECYLDDEVILFGRSGDEELPIWKICNAIDAIPYELLCGLTARVPRIYI